MRATDDLDESRRSAQLTKKIAVIDVCYRMCKPDSSGRERDKEMIMKDCKLIEDELFNK